MPDDTDTQTIPACPEPGCTSSNITGRRGGDLRGGRPTDDNDYRCAKCGHTFDDPLERPKWSDGTRLPNGGEALKNADLDELLSGGGRDE